MNRTQVYLNEAERCTQRLEVVSDPNVRARIERERRDWVELARACEGA